MAASESLNALFIGGMTESSQFKPVSGKTASIFRLDLLQARRNHAQFTYLGRGKSWDCKTVFGREY